MNHRDVCQGNKHNTEQRRHIQCSGKNSRLKLQWTLKASVYAGQVVKTLSLPYPDTNSTGIPQQVHTRWGTGWHPWTNTGVTKNKGLDLCMTSSSSGGLFAHQALLNPPSSPNSISFQRDELWGCQPQCRANVPNDKHPPSLPKMCLKFKWAWI